MAEQRFGSERRQFLKLSLMAASAGLALGTANAGDASGETRGRILAGLHPIGLGTWQSFDVAAHERAARCELLATFSAAGTMLVDTSPMYGRAEAVLGHCLSGLASGDTLKLASKIWTEGEAEGKAQLRATLSLLGPRQIDLMQVHNLLDVQTHLRTLADARERGEVLAIGVTHYQERAHAELGRWARDPRVQTVQVNLSLAEPAAAERLIPACHDLGVSVLVNRPFAEGAMFRQVQHKPVPEWAGKELGCASWAQYFLKFVLGHAGVDCVLAATTRAQHLQDNLAAAQGPRPDAAQLRRMRQEWQA